jgi:hypothetical protein
MEDKRNDYRTVEMTQKSSKIKEYLQAPSANLPSQEVHWPINLNPILYKAQIELLFISTTMDQYIKKLIHDKIYMSSKPTTFNWNIFDIEHVQYEEK